MKHDTLQIKPLFIVGSPRSGTTVVMRAVETLDSFYSPHVEGHCMPWLLEGIDRVLGDSKHNSHAFLPTSICTGENFDKLLSWLARAIHGFMQEVGGVSEPNNLHWIDKTPDLPQLRRLPLLQRIFPNSKAIFMYRHPRDVVLSTRNVWNPKDSDKTLLQRWTHLQREYRTKIRPRLIPQNVLEIQQESLITQPDVVGKRIGEFLVLSPHSQVSLTKFFKQKRINRKPEMRSRGFTYLDKANANFLRLVDSVCGKEMLHWGYTSAVQTFPVATNDTYHEDKDQIRSREDRTSLDFRDNGISPLRQYGAAINEKAVKPRQRKDFQDRMVTHEEFLRSYHIVSKLYPHVPSLSLWRSWEHAAFQEIRLREPVLDLGCGDGRFFKLLWPDVHNVEGVDADINAIKAAEASGVYCHAKKANADRLPFEDAAFASVFANCSLEHMNNLDAVLAEIDRVLREDGIFVFSIVTDNFIKWAVIPQIARAIGYEHKAREIQNNYEAYHNVVNPFSIEQWVLRLNAARFVISDCIRIVPELTARLFLFIDHLWHLKLDSRELGQTLYERLIKMSQFPDAFGQILNSVIRLESNQHKCAGAVFTAKKSIT